MHAWRELDPPCYSAYTTNGPGRLTSNSTIPKLYTSTAAVGRSLPSSSSGAALRRQRMRQQRVSASVPRHTWDNSQHPLLEPPR